MPQNHNKLNHCSGSSIGGSTTAMKAKQQQRSSFRKDLQREMKKSFGKFFSNRSQQQQGFQFHLQQQQKDHDRGLEASATKDSENEASIEVSTPAGHKFFSFGDDSQSVPSSSTPALPNQKSQQFHPSPNMFSSPDCHNFLVCNLPMYIKNRILGDSVWLEEEFQLLQQFDSQMARRKDYFASAKKYPKKNRFSSVLANEETRVTYSQDSERYINANHIRGAPFEVKQDYIATQAPLPDTGFVDFWDMVFEQDTRVIVMLADQINESSRKRRCLSSGILSSVVESEYDPFGFCDQRRKVHQYWPNAKEKHVYGDIFVENIRDTNCKSDNLIIRECLLTKEGHEPRLIKLYHFLGWPDMGCPKLMPFMHLMNRIDEELCQNPDMGPILLHCVAGCGRTGAFAAVHIVLTQLRNFMRLHKEQNDEDQMTDTSSDNDAFCFNIHDTVMELKRARRGMVQEKEQYEFVYTTILEGCKQMGYHFPDSIPEFGSNGR